MITWDWEECKEESRGDGTVEELKGREENGRGMKGKMQWEEGRRGKGAGKGWDGKERERKGGGGQMCYVTC